MALRTREIDLATPLINETSWDVFSNARTCPPRAFFRRDFICRCLWTYLTDVLEHTINLAVLE